MYTYTKLILLVALKYDGHKIIMYTASKLKAINAPFAYIEDSFLHIHKFLNFQNLVIKLSV